MMTGFVHDEYSLLRVEFLLARVGPFISGNMYIKLLLTGDLSSSIFFQACHAYDVMICFGHVKNFSSPCLAIIPWLYVLTWAITCGLSSPL